MDVSVIEAARHQIEVDGVKTGIERDDLTGSYITWIFAARWR